RRAHALQHGQQHEQVAHEPFVLGAEASGDLCEPRRQLLGPLLEACTLLRDPAQFRFDTCAVLAPVAVHALAELTLPLATTRLKLRFEILALVAQRLEPLALARNARLHFGG